MTSHFSESDILYIHSKLVFSETTIEGFLNKYGSNILLTPFA